jgi:DNA-binding CsgD family transcriptional regulator
MTLTPRELDVMVALAVTGGSYVEVAELLGIRPQTVKNHAYAAREKLNVQTNTAAFTEMGWLNPVHEDGWVSPRVRPHVFRKVDVDPYRGQDRCHHCTRPEADSLHELRWPVLTKHIR